MRAKRGNEVLRIEPLGQYLIQYQQRRSIIPGKKTIHKPETILIIQHVQIVHHIFIPDIRTAEGHHLVKNGKCITHRPISLPGNYMERFTVYGNILLRCNVFQITHDIRYGYPAEIVCLAAAQDCRQYLVLFGGRKNENSVCRRFLQGLQERIERLGRKHVHLIYDKHRVLSRLRRNLHQFHQILDILHPIIGSGIKLMDAIRAAFSK